MGGRDHLLLERERLWFINSPPKAVAGNVFTHYLPIQLQPLRSRIGGADAQSGKASRSMFNKVRLSTIDYTTGRVLQLLSMPLAALKTVFPETCGDFTEMLLGGDTHTTSSWICLGCAAPFWSKDKLLKKMVFAAG